jgi:hypothetical protein
MPSRRRGRLLIVVLCVLSMGAAACGRDDFENDPRPPVPLEVSVAILEDTLRVSPGTFGAGLVNFTIANLSDSEASLEIDGPTQSESPEIAPGDNAILKAQMEEGSYTFALGGATSQPVLVEVGPERESAQDDLLLP